MDEATKDLQNDVMASIPKKVKKMLKKQNK